MNTDNNDTTSAEPSKKRTGRPRSKYRSPNFTVLVAQKHIDTAIPKDSNHCMIADAIREAFPAARSIAVDTATIRFTDPTTGLRYIYLTPGICQHTLINFDEGRAPSPFQFDLKRAVQIVTMYKSKKNENGETRQVKAVDLGRKRVQDEGTGTVPTIIGGATPPMRWETETVQSEEASADTSGDATEKKGRAPGVKINRRKHVRAFGIRGYKDGSNVMLSNT